MKKTNIGILKFWLHQKHFSKGVQKPNLEYIKIIFIIFIIIIYRNCTNCKFSRKIKGHV